MGALLAAMSAGSCDKVPLLAPTESIITLTARNTFLPVNTETEITATVIESAGTAVQNGTLVTFATTLGTVEPREARTRNGQVLVKFVAGRVSGEATITALSGSATLPEDTDPLTILIGAAAAGRVSVTANPASLPSTGGTTEIQARVFDVGGNPLAGVPVSFAVEVGTGEGQSTGAGTLTRTLATTDAQGVARTTLTTTATTTVEATVGGGGGGEDDPGPVSGTVTVRVNEAPAVSITVAPDAPVEGQPVTFTITPANDLTLRNVRIRFGDGESATLGVISGATTVSHVYDSDGTFTVRVTGTDNAGEEFSTATEVVVADVAPPGVVIATTPAGGSIAIGSPITFTATVTGTGGTTPLIERVRWDFGDGHSATTTGPQVSHIYGGPPREVRVRVSVETTNTGTGRGEIEIAITEP
jgi:PKD repeat protein